MQLSQSQVLCYRLFDVGDEIDLEQCRTLIEKARRVTLEREGSEYLQLSNPPLAIDLGIKNLMVADVQLPVQVGARVFDFGAISIQLRVPVLDGVTFDDLIPFADALYDSKDVDALAASEAQRLEQLLRPAIEMPHRWNQSEAYSVLWVRSAAGDTLASDVLAEPALARLLLGENKEKQLSALETHEVLRHHFSYGLRDLTVIEWNAALVMDPSGSEDIFDLLEMANAQLLQLRYYDEVLDGALRTSYDEIGKSRRSPLLFSPYSKHLRTLMRRLIELSEFIERAENAIKIVGDVYLARVYQSALEQLRIPEWTQQVSRKHRLLQQTYGLLKGEVDTARALTLEIMVVVLFIFEIVMAFIPLLRS